MPIWPMAGDSSFSRRSRAAGSSWLRSARPAGTRPVDRRGICGDLRRRGARLLAYHRRSSCSVITFTAGRLDSKYLHEPVQTSRWHALEIRYTNGQPFELLRGACGLDMDSTNHFGLFFYLFVMSLLYSLWRRRNLLLMTLALGLCAYLEFGPVRIAFDRTPRDHPVHRWFTSRSAFS